MSKKKYVKISKIMSYILRHRPESIGGVLDDYGWISVSELLSAFEQHGHNISFDDIRNVVDTCDKKRFALSPDGHKIRAQYGHSVNVSIDYDSIKPPSVLYHGTAEKFMGSIKLNGIKKGRRQFVHLSEDCETAVKVGSRRGIPVVLRINAADMYSDGYKFYRSGSGIWLVDAVPAEYFVLVKM